MWNRITLIVLTLFMGTAVILFAHGLERNNEQTDEIERLQEIQISAVCAAAKVIANEPSRQRSYTEGETQKEYLRRVRGYRTFIIGARELCE